MTPFNTAPDIILDFIFLRLSEEDLHETLRVSKSWFWASIRRIKKLKIVWRYNPLKSIATFYNEHRGSVDDELDWPDLFKYLNLDELVVNLDDVTISYLVNNSCNTAKLTIETSRNTTPASLAFLKKVTRLESFEYCIYMGISCHSFIAECFKSYDSGFDPDILRSIEAIKLNSGGWNSEDPVLHSVTKLSVRNVTIGFLRLLIQVCPNLEELHCSYSHITRDWHQVFSSNVKRIEFHHFTVNSDLAAIVDASTDSARHLLPYLCQNWESVEIFHFDGYIYFGCTILYQAFPQEREEVFMCELFNVDINLASPLFQCREIHVKCDGRKALELTIPPAKSVMFEFHVEHDFRFSPRAVCLEPGEVERLALILQNDDEINPDPFGSSSFQGFGRLTSLTLSHVSTLSIIMSLDQCPSIMKLKLKGLEAMEIGNIPDESSYANVCELVLKECEEPMYRVFQVFPCLSKFKYSVLGKDEIRKETTDWLCQHLVSKDKRYGVLFEADEIRYMVSDDLQAPLTQAQKLLNKLLDSKCYLKGFKLIPRISKQKLFYIN